MASDWYRTIAQKVEYVVKFILQTDYEEQGCNIIFVEPESISSCVYTIWPKTNNRNYAFFLAMVPPRAFKYVLSVEMLYNIW